MSTFSPRMDILPEAQRSIWPGLAAASIFYPQTFPPQQVSSDIQFYELRRHPVLRGVAQRSGPGGAR
jgi:hypothetical protein